jgi:hypothetical protein
MLQWLLPVSKHFQECLRRLKTILILIKWLAI